MLPVWSGLSGCTVRLFFGGVGLSLDCNRWVGFGSGLGLSEFGLGGGGFSLYGGGDFWVQEIGHCPSQANHPGTEVVKLNSGNCKLALMVFFQALVDGLCCLGKVP